MDWKYKKTVYSNCVKSNLGFCNNRVFNQNKYNENVTQTFWPNEWFAHDTLNTYMQERI